MAVGLALAAVSLSFAEVHIKDLDGKNVEITFTYADKNAQEMGVIGSFDNWTVPGEAMTKDAAGVWHKTIKALAADEITYKFYSAGSWIPDPMAPDSKDDGYGGKNGLIVVADILSGAVPEVPAAAAGAAPAPAAADAAPAAKPKATSKVNFGNYTILGSKSTFSTQGVVDKGQKGLETDTTGLYAKSYWKLGGTWAPGFTGWMEIKAFDSYNAVWAQDSRGIVSPDLGTGLKNLGFGLLTNPIRTLGGGDSVLNSVKSGFETPVVAWEGGIGYAKTSTRTSALWQTVKEQDANNGYSRFDLGPALKTVGPFTVEATVAPNLMTGNLGFFGWVGLSHDATKVDFQYDVKSASTTKVTEFADKLYHQDFLLGLKTKVGPFDVTGQALVNQFSETAFATDRNVAAEGKVFFSPKNDGLGLTAGYRYTGLGSVMLYGNNDDYLGDQGTQRLLANWSQKLAGPLKGGVDTSVTLVTAEVADQAYELYAKPWASFDLSSSLGKKSELSGYVKAKDNLKAGYEYDGSSTSWIVGEVGAKVSVTDLVPKTVTNFDATYGLNNWEADKVFQTVITTWKFPKDLAAELGLGLRTLKGSPTDAETEANNPVAFSIGSSLKINEPALKSPLFYTAFVYNMDPYDDGTNNLDWADNIPDGGISKGDGKATLRILMKWDF